MSYEQWDESWTAYDATADAELALICSCFASEDAFWEASSAISPEQFLKETHAVLFEAIAEGYREGAGGDINILLNRLVEKGCPDLLKALSYEHYSPSMVSKYADIVINAWKRRQVNLICNSGVLSTETGKGSTDVLIQEIVNDLASLNSESPSSEDGGALYSSALTRYLDPDMRNKRRAGVRTGIDSIDRHWGLLAGGSLNVVAARTGVGKTSFALSIVHSVLQQDLGVYLFSLEMPSQEIADRLISMSTGIPVVNLREGLIGRAGGSKLANVREPKHLRVDDEPAISADKILARAARMQASDKLDIVVIDYLQLMGGVAENRREVVAGNARKLKVLAKQLNVPVIALAQLNRNPEYRDGGRPRLSDLKESGEIEQSADTVTLLTRDHTRSRIYLAKNRHGSLAEWDMDFVPETTLFRDSQMEFIP